MGKLVVPQRQGRGDGRRDVVGDEGVPGHGGHAGRLPPQRPCQRVRRVVRRGREVDNAVNIIAVVVG